jgi:hypothetical protein
MHRPGVGTAARADRLLRRPFGARHGIRRQRLSARRRLRGTRWPDADYVGSNSSGRVCSRSRPARTLACLALTTC